MAEIKQIHGFTDPLSVSQMRTQNPDLFETKLPRMFPIHRHIYIFSTARRDFPKKHVYWAQGVLRGCHKGERYVCCGSIADPPQQLSVDPDRGGLRVDVEPRDEAGWRVAIDILNPNNPSLDPYIHLNSQQAALYATGQNVDLIRYGLFPSLNETPTDAELEKAEAVRNDSYQKLVDEAFQEQASNPQGFRMWLRNNPDVNTAMEALGITADWHTKAEIKATCPNCGDTIKAGIAFHKSSAGVLCIIDPERAAKAGVRVEQDEDEPQRRGPGRPRKDSVAA
jgi:hypothetical protein